MAVHSTSPVCRVMVVKEVIQYVSNYEDEFVRMIMDSDMRQRNRELSQKKKRLAEIQKRIGELDTIFQRSRACRWRSG